MEGVEFISQADPSITLLFRVSGPMDIDQVTLSQGQLVSALAMFCKCKEIPLPLSSDKRVHCENGKVVLHFEMLHRIPCEKTAAIA